MHYFMVCFALDIDLSVLVKVVQDHTKDIVSGFNFPYPLRKTTLAIVDVFRDSPTRFIHEAEIATEARLDRNRTDDGIRQLCALGWIQRDTAEGSQRQCYWRLSDQGVQELPQMCAYLDRLHELAMIVINSSRSTVATPHENTATRK
jgi:DNA-binding MarR family transcriptional regulator